MSSVIPSLPDTFFHKPIIISYIRGGLGNQLLQYATGYALAKKNNADFKLHAHEWYQPCDVWNNSGIFRWQLEHYNLSSVFASSDEIHHLDIRQVPGYAQSLRPSRLKRLFLPKHLRTTVAPVPDTVYEEGDSIAYNPALFERKGSTYVRGYFPSYKYFHHLRDELLPLFQLNHSISVKGGEVLSKIKNTKFPIAVHFRRGDFVTNPDVAKWVKGISTPEYYNNAVKLILEKLGEGTRAHIFAFSDDIEWVKANFTVPCDITFVDHSTPFMGYEDIYLMSQCHHHVLSGFSSFSFWGAYLCKNPDQVVIRTRQLNNDPNLNHPDDFYLPHWQIAESD